MADADIKLDGAKAIVEGNWLVVECMDINLDCPDRRSQQTGARRALVHGHNDELVINFGKDYPGGVTIRGEIHIPEKIKQNHLRLESHDLHLDHPDRRKTTSGGRRALVHGHNDELVVNFANDYPGGVTIRGEIKIPEKIKQNHLRLESHDLHLDHPDRRKTTGGSRRALVHGFDDELALNFQKDYPGGTVVHGNLAVKKSGSIQVKNSNDDPIISANHLGVLTLGGNGRNGNIKCQDQTGNELIRIDSQYNRIDFKDTTGPVKVRISTDHFTESDWPAWPRQRTPSRLDLIREMRRMKEEILELRALVDQFLGG